MRRWIAERLRFLADRIHPDGAFRMTSLSFYFRTGVGVVVDQEGLAGCPLWFRGTSDYDLAHHVPETTPQRCPASMSWSQV